MKVFSACFIITKNWQSSNGTLTIWKILLWWHWWSKGKFTVLPTVWQEIAASYEEEHEEYRR
jgi:hypothetical protein